MSTTTKTYKLTTDHPASSYGIPVFVDANGRALGYGDIGISSRMMDAVAAAYRDGATVAEVYDSGHVVCR